MKPPGKMPAMRAPATPTLLGQSGLTLLQSAGLVLFGSLILILSAKAKVPFYPVPMTLQTLAIGLIAAGAGARIAVATVALYLAQGALGLPVFTNTPPATAGLAYFAGPTGGYLIGFLVSALIVGTLADHGWTRSPLKLFAALMLGDLSIIALGTAWLAYGATLASGAQGMGFEKALAAGATPFLLGALVKEAFGTALITGVWALADRKNSA
jgi:biotin transport system substrate-specific component